MKLLLLFFLLLSSLYAESSIYIGTNAGVYHESFSEVDAKSSAEMATLKVGYGDRKAYAVEFSLDYLHNNSKVFSTSTDASKDGDKYGFNVSLLKAFDFDIYLLPFAKVGFGTGIFNIDRALQKSLTYGTFNFTLGTFLPLSQHFDAEIGYEIRHTSYESINTIATKTSYGSTTNIAYVGINYRF